MAEWDGDGASVAEVVVPVPETDSRAAVAGVAVPVLEANPMADPRRAAAAGVAVLEGVPRDQLRRCGGEPPQISTASSGPARPSLAQGWAGMLSNHRRQHPLLPSRRRTPPRTPPRCPGTTPGRCRRRALRWRGNPETVDDTARVAEGRALAMWSA